MTHLLAATAGESTAAGGAVIVAVFAVIGAFSLIALFTGGGRRLLMPVTALLLGLAIGATTISEARWNRISPITFLGLGMAALLVFGGLGALREGIILPDVEGHDPDIPAAEPRIIPDDVERR